MRPRRVLMVGLDAMEPRLVEEGIRTGSLPHLAALRERGAMVRLTTSARWLVGSPWPTFYTGRGPAHHGLYHYLTWDPDRMDAVRPGPDAVDAEPFWRHLGPDRRVVAVDMPLTFPPGAFNGVEINGWATHDRLAPPSSHPAGLLHDVQARFGPPPLEDEVHRPLSVPRLLETRDELVRATRRVGELGADLAREQAWDLFLLTLSTTHRGGHKLWVDEDTVVAGLDPAGPLGDALHRVYTAADETVGRLVDAAGADTAVIVFSVHGMGPNICHTGLLGEMVRKVLAGGVEASTAAGGGGGFGRGVALLRSVRELVPLAVRNEVKRRLPVSLQDRLTSFWRTGGIRWEETEAFCPPADLQGYLRLNVRGREARGAVDPDRTDEVAERVADGLREFVDADTGEPVVRDVVRTRDVVGEGARLDRLPDLLVDWEPVPVVCRRAVRAPRFGTVEVARPGLPPDGRSGNHRTEGFALVAGIGDDVTGDNVRVDGDILDLAPTALDLLDVEPPDAMEGCSLLRSETREG